LTGLSFIKMLRAFRFPLRTISNYLSSDSEPRLEDETRGVVVRSLPKNLSQDELIRSLGQTFQSSKIELRTDVQGNPAFAILRFDEEKLVRAALSLHKTPISNKKVYVSVFPM